MSDFLKKIGLLLVDFIETILTAITIFAVINFFIFQPHQVRGESMETNFHNGQNLLTSRLAYRFYSPQRGDVVVFKSPQNKKLDYIKRIIALPGETVALKNGKFYINGKLLDESQYYPSSLTTKGSIFLAEGNEIIVPENQYFVVGDNRAHSSDSREWGFVPKENLVGKAWFSYWPPSDFGLIPKIAW